MALLDTLHRLHCEQRKRTYDRDPPRPIKALRIGRNQWIDLLRECDPSTAAMCGFSQNPKDGTAECFGTRLYVDIRYDGIEVEYVEGAAANEIVPAICKTLGLSCRRI